MIYRPLYVDKIMTYTDTPFVKILTGVRRCGKSTYLTGRYVSFRIFTLSFSEYLMFKSGVSI